RQRMRMATAELRRLATPLRKTLSIKEACFQVMEAAYLKASANGTLPAKGRQIMYAARPMVMALTGGQFYKPDTQTFQQQTLIVLGRRLKLDGVRVEIDSRGVAVVTCPDSACGAQRVWEPRKSA